MTTSSSPSTACRPIYEGVSALGWISAAGLSLGMVAGSAAPALPLWFLGGTSGVMAAKRAWEAWRLLERKISLVGRGFEAITSEQVIENAGDLSKYVWMGKGFVWENEHSQMCYDMLREKSEKIAPPQWLISAYEKITHIKLADEESRGIGWIHGIEKEEDIRLFTSDFEGHTQIFGAPGSGKTRVLEYVITHSVHRRDVTIIVDPKDDREMERRARREAKRTGCRYHFFSMTRPSESVRLDTLANFSDVTELATRLSVLLQSGATMDTFVAFSWSVINKLAQALYFIDSRSTILKIRRFIDGGSDALLEFVLQTHFTRVGPENWRDVVAAKIEAYSKKTDKPRLAAYIDYYKSVMVKQELVHEAINGLLSMAEHDRDHFSKMITTLSPLLDTLTSGDMGSILSPDAFDIDDERPIINLSRLIENGGVLYVGLNSLINKTITNTLASLVASDIASTAGSIYSEFSKGFRKGKPARVGLIIDEGYVALNESLIEAANKGRGAGLEITMATQTVADYASKLGSTDKADQVLGNFNNILSLRVTDEKTQAYVAKRIFGECWINSHQKSYSNTSSTEHAFIHFSGGVQQRSNENMLPGFPPDLLGRLPNWQYVALFSGRKPIKGRVPVMTYDE